VREAILNRRTYEAPAEGRSDKLRLDFNEKHYRLLSGGAARARQADDQTTGHVPRVSKHPRGGLLITSVSARKNCC